MKKLFFLLIVTVVCGRLSAQTQEASCYNQWAKAFELRGADDVKDGSYEGVVLSIRSGSKTICYTAKVLVEAGNVKDIAIKYVDGKFEQYKPEWKYADQKAVITNGISHTLQTMEDDLVNVIFINHLKAKKKAFELAPLPGIDD